MRWRHVPSVTAALVLVPAAVAQAAYRGTDLWGNIAPPVDHVGLADKYPLSFYALDTHVDGPHVGVPVVGGGISTGDIPSLIAQFLASVLFQFTIWMTKLVLDIFDWAFSIDLLNGAHGALAPIGSATQALFTNTLGPSFLIAAVVLVGIWAMGRGLVQRRFSDVVASVAMSVLIAVIAMLIILKPEATIGTASQMTNTMSNALLTGATATATGDSNDARVRAEDHLFRTFVYNPWVVMEFGGLQHCVSSDRDKDGFPKPVPPGSPDATTCIDHVTAANGVGGYAPRFLSAAPDSDERDQMYEALKNGESNSTWPGWNITKADAPGVDIQQAGGAFQRLALAVLIFVGALGAILLLGLLAFAALLAQVIALVLLAFAPAALLAGLIPGWGHKLFRSWLSKLAIALFIKAVYSLILAILIAVSLALDAAAGQVSYLFAFGLQAAFFWIIFLKRKALSGIMLTNRETTRVERTTREAIATPVAAAAGVGWAGGVAAARRARGRTDDEGEAEQQEHVGRPGRQAPKVPAEDEVVAATPGTPTRPSAPYPPLFDGDADAERVPVQPAEPARGSREDLAVALDAAGERSPAPAPSQTPPVPPPSDAPRPPRTRTVAETIEATQAPPPGQQRAERPGHLARPVDDETPTPDAARGHERYHRED